MKATILVLPGDGIGPEVAAEGVRVLQTVARIWGHDFDFPEALLGGCAIDATGNAFPEETHTAASAADAILLGAVGGPKWDDPNAKVRPEQGLLGIRKALGLFANLRPVSLHPALVGASPLRAELLKGVDLLVVRELTGGIYFGEKRRETINGVDTATDTCTYTATEVERVVRAAAELARARRGKLTSVDKANVLESSRLWRRVSDRVMREEYPELQHETILVDACAMHLIRRPADFDVIVTENMFGDILTDEASMLAGSMGLLPSASLGAAVEGRSTRPGLYEPIHGSAPDIAGQGIANPIATILSAALLLRHSLGLEEEAAAVERAVAKVLDAGLRTRDLVGPGEKWETTAAVGAAVAEAVAGGQGTPLPGVQV
ncbi:MAG: 3-isopropylmalate dehydrogenase [Gemmatimonadota bacterium]|jgi:3-isopropylmalate dehydrogenase|nr:3-isopropylmalate dehydrogenase [Gemmatimonadota bacterium]